MGGIEENETEDVGGEWERMKVTMQWIVHGWVVCGKGVHGVIWEGFSLWFIHLPNTKAAALLWKVKC